MHLIKYNLWQILISYIGMPSSGHHPGAATCRRLIFVKNYILLSAFFGVKFNRLPKFKFVFAGKVLGFICFHDCNRVGNEYRRLRWQKLANSLSEGRYCGNCYNTRKRQNFGASLFTNMLIHPSLSVVTRVLPFSRVHFDNLSFIFVLLKDHFALGYFVVIINLPSH